jgi:hypothetical protein
MNRLCRKPDDRGRFNPCCQHIIQSPKAEKEPRQCRRAATNRSPFCGSHHKLRTSAAK